MMSFHLHIYCIAANYGPGVYFFPATFYLGNYMRTALIIWSSVSNFFGQWITLAAGSTRVTNLLNTAHHEMDSILCSHHLYKSMIVIREPSLGRSLPANLKDEFAVTVIMDSQIVSHIPSDIIFTCHVVFYHTKGVCRLSYYWEKEERKRLRSTI